MEQQGSTLTTIAFGVGREPKSGRNSPKRELLLEWLLRCPRLEQIVVGDSGPSMAATEQRFFGSLNSSLSHVRETLRVMIFFYCREVSADVVSLLKVGWPALQELRLQFCPHFEGDLMDHSP